MKTVIRRWVAGWAIALQAFGAAAAAPQPAADRMPSTVAHDRCSWDHPGVNPFMGDVVAAVDRYRDIPPEVRERLKARMAKREYDDLVSIRRDAITGRGGYRYDNAIGDMHFGTDQVCHTVTRASWTPQMEERGLVYCESGTCILVPTVCRNVSRVSRNGVGNDVAEGLPPFLPPGAGYPAVPAAANEAVPEAFPLLDAPLAAASPALTGLGPVRDGGPIGNAYYLGSTGGPVVVGGVGGSVGAYGGGGGGGGGAPGGGAGGGTGAGSNIAGGASDGRPGTAGVGGTAGSTGGGTTDGTTDGTTGNAGGGSVPAGTDASTTPSIDAGTTAVTPVPEPGTWALMLGGIVALGFVCRAGRR